MRLLHTSDWHLGRTLHGASLLEDQRQALAQLLGVVDQERPDVVVIAGDLYDRSVPPAEAVSLCDEVLRKLVAERRVPTVCIAGNHDSPERLGFGAELMRAQGLFLVGPLPSRFAPVVIDDEHGPVDLAPLPYAGPEVVRAAAGDEGLRGHDGALRWMAAEARAALAPGRRSVAIAHAFVTGGTLSDTERPLVVGGTGEVPAEVFAGFDYVALGHLHQAQSVGEPRVRYSGSLLKYSFREVAHEKSVTLVELDATGAVATRVIPLSPRRDLRAVSGTLQQLLESAAPTEDYLQVTLEDPGPVPDAMARLREVFPNVLHIERPHTGLRTGERGLPRDHRKTGPLELFHEFWRSGEEREPLSDEEAALLRRVIEEARRSEDGEAAEPAKKEDA